MNAFFQVWEGVVAYAALSTVLLAIAYLVARPRLLGKQPSGRQSVVARVLFAPYFLVSTLAFHLYRLTTREAASAEFLPGFYFGRRLINREAMQGNWAGVLDLAAEFAEVPYLRRGNYLSLPVLDATAPTTKQLAIALDFLSDHQKQNRGAVLIHCALGHGRSACVAVAYLLDCGEVQTVAEGEQRLRMLRPGVRLNRRQRTCLRQEFECQ